MSVSTPAPAPIAFSTPQGLDSESDSHCTSTHTDGKTISVTEFRIYRKFLHLLACYNEPWNQHNHESELYAPFVNLANCCLEDLNPEEIQFRRNALAYSRKPDSVNGAFHRSELLSSAESILPAPPRVPTYRFGQDAIALNDGRPLTLNETIFQSHGIFRRVRCVSGSKMEVGCKILYKEEKAFEEYSSQRRLAMHLGDKPQVLRIVFQEEIHPITELTTAADLQEAFRGVFECHRWLYEKAEIMHRDVSLKNLMYRRIDGKVYGVLNDFDLSVFRDDAHLSTSHLRTGTKPHMALDLLVLGPPPPHLYRFNLESLFYVFVHIVCQPEYHDGKKIVNLKPPFDAWDHLPITLLCDNKWRFITTPILEVSPTPKFLKLEPFMEDLYDMFMEGYNARGPGKAVIARRRRLRALAPTNSDEYHFDEETLGGNITFEKFAKILNDQDPNSQ